MRISDWSSDVCSSDLYTGHEGEGRVLALVKDGARVDSAKAGDEVTIITNQTPFYGESGGQMGDAGNIRNDSGLEAEVSDTSKPLGRLHAPHATVKSGAIKVGAAVRPEVDADRPPRIRPTPPAPQQRKN